MTTCRIAADFQLYLCNQVFHDWAKVSPEARPETFWIAEHECVSDPDGHLGTPIVACWYFDGHDFIIKPAADFTAFMNLAAGYSSKAGRFEIGYCGFAPISDSEDVALYWQFGGHHGTGYRFSRRGDTYSREEAWRS